MSELRASLTTRKADARGILRDAGLSESEILEIIPSDQPPATGDRCMITGASSAVCNRGTKSCEIHHDEWTVYERDGQWFLMMVDVGLQFQGKTAVEICYPIDIDLSALDKHVTEKTKPLVDALEWAWTIIANAGGGDWERESKDWQDAAAKWRDEAFYPALAKAKESKCTTTKK
jgi:hypothetical protein